jgi:hypothetical protein
MIELMDTGSKCRSIAPVFKGIESDLPIYINSLRLAQDKESEISQDRDIVRDCEFKGKVITFDAL